MISIMAGIMIFMTRLVNSWVFIRFLLAVSNRSSSYFSRSKARMTESPVRISLATRFRRSTSVCIFLNLGIATARSVITSTKIATTATTMIQLSPVRVPATLMMPPMPMIGA